MDIQFIFTSDLEQFYTPFMPLDKEDINTSDSLLSFAMQQLTEKEKIQVVKISCCLDCRESEVPQWFMAANGKFWEDDIESWKYRQPKEKDYTKWLDL